MRQAVLIFLFSFTAITEPLNDTVLYKVFQLNYFFFLFFYTTGTFMLYKSVGNQKEVGHGVIPISSNAKCSGDKL